MKSRKKDVDIFVKSPDGIAKLYYQPENQYYKRSLFSDPTPELGTGLPLICMGTNDEHCYKGSYRERENSNVFAVEFVMEGCMRVDYDGVENEVMAGEIYLVHHGCNIITQPGSGDYCHRMSCILEGVALNVILDSLNLNRNNIIRGFDRKRVKEIMTSIHAEMSAMKCNFRQRMSSLCYELLVTIAEKTMHSKMPPEIQKAMAIFEMHIHDRLTLNKLAVAIGVSQRNLTNIFHRHLNCSPMKYLANMRMEKAKTMLVSSNMLIREIAFQCGYENPYHFSLEFRKNVGSAPKYYRMAHGPSRRPRKKF